MSEREFQFEVGQLVKVVHPGLFHGTTEKVEQRKLSSDSGVDFALYCVKGQWYYNDELEARTLDAFEQFVYDHGVLDLYDRAAKVGYRVRAVLPDGRIQGEYAGGNESWYKTHGTFTGTRTEVEAFLSERERELNAL